jgi:hypothetical protein
MGFTDYFRIPSGLPTNVSAILLGSFKLFDLALLSAVNAT